MRIIPAWPGCGQPATIRIEIYSPTPTGGLHGSLDAVAYSCDRHAGAVEQMLQDAGLTPWRDRRPYEPIGEEVPAVCGTLRRFTTPVEPAGDTDHNGTPADPELITGNQLPEPTDAAVAAFVAANRVPLPNEHPRWCNRNDTDRTHRSTLFRVTDRIALQIEQPHGDTEPGITLLDGVSPRSVRFPLDVARSLGRQLRVAVSLAGMDLR